MFTGQEGGKKTPETSDAVASSFPATVTQRLSVVATSGTVKAAAVAPRHRLLQKVTIPADALPGLGGLEVSASTSALAGLQSSIASLVEYPYGRLEQRTSRSIPGAPP